MGDIWQRASLHIRTAPRRLSLMPNIVVPDRNTGRRIDLPMNRASFQSTKQDGINLYIAKIAGMRRRTTTKKPRPTRRGMERPVDCGPKSSNNGHGITMPMYAKAPKFRRKSIVPFTSSCLFSHSRRNCPFQLRTLPAAKQARMSLAPMSPVEPTVNLFSILSVSLRIRAVVIADKLLPQRC